MALEDYIIVPIKKPSSSAAGGTTTHHLYIRQTTARSPAQADQKTLFIANIPIDSTPAHFKALFAPLGGRTADIKFHSIQDTSKYIAPEDVAMELETIQDEKFSKEVKRLKRASVLPELWNRTVLRSGSNAYVTFVDIAELNTVMKALRDLGNKGQELIWGEGIPKDRVPPALGIDRYRDHLERRCPNPAELQEGVDAYMELFNKEEILRRKKSKLQRSEPDEDGFVTITRGSRIGTAARAQNAEAIKKKAEGRGIVTDFYRFQKRDENKAKLNAMRMRFEEDKKKISELRSRRKFLG